MKGDQLTMAPSLGLVLPRWNAGPHSAGQNVGIQAEKFGSTLLGGRKGDLIAVD
jgi:hypothetical protein